MLENILMNREEVIDYLVIAMKYHGALFVTQNGILYSLSLIHI